MIRAITESAQGNARVFRGNGHWFLSDEVAGRQNNTIAKTTARHHQYLQLPRILLHLDPRFVTIFLLTTSSYVIVISDPAIILSKFGTAGTVNS
jgi:hypothetical protein